MKEELKTDKLILWLNDVIVLQKHNNIFMHYYVNMFYEKLVVGISNLKVDK